MVDQTREEHVIELKAKLDPSLKAALNGLKQAQASVTAEYAKLALQIKQLESQGANVRPLVNQLDALGDAVTRTTTQATRSVTGSEAAARGLEKWSRSVQILENELTALPVKIQQINQRLAQLEQSGDTSSNIYRLYQQELANLTAQQNKLTGTNTTNAKSFGRLNTIVQQAGFQIGDFAVQMASGQRASVAFAQQAPQLLGAFGAIGAVLGVAAVFIGVFAAKWIDSIGGALSPTIALTNNTKKLDAALANIGKTLQTIDLAPLFDDITKAEESLQTALLSTAKINLKNVSALYETELDLLDKTVGFSLNKIANTISTSGQGGTNRAIRESANEAKALADQFKLTTAQAREFATVLRQRDVSALSAFAESVSDANKGNQEFFTFTQKYIESLRKRTDALEKTSEVEKALNDIRDKRLSVTEAVVKIETNSALLALQAAEKRAQAEADYVRTLAISADLKAKLSTVIAEEQKAAEKLRKEYDSVVDSVASATEQYAKGLAEINNLRDALGADFDEEIYARVIKKLNDELDAARLKEYRESLNEFQKTIFDQLEAYKKFNEEQERTNGLLAFYKSVEGNPAFLEYLNSISSELIAIAEPADAVQIAFDKLNSQTTRTQELNAALQQFAELNQLSAKQVENLANSLGLQAKKTNELQTSLQSAAKDGLNTFADELINLTENGKFAFDNFVKSIVRNIATLIIQYNLLRIAQSALPGVFGTPTVASAQGNAFSKGVKAFAQGGIIAGPTFFGLQGGLGLAGEAGPEAILPLRRDSSGNLGVEASVNVNIQNFAPATEVLTTQRDNGDIDVIVKRISQDVMRGGNDVSRSIERAYGLSRSGGNF